MGYSIDAYLIDLEVLGRIFASQDLQLVSDIETHLAEELHRLNGFIAETNAELEDDYDPAYGPLILCPTVNTALRAYVAGRILEPVSYSFSPYRFALNLICAHLGTALPSEPFQMLRSGVGFLERDVPLIGEVVFRSPPLGPVPFPEEWRRDWHIGYLTWERAVEQRRTWQTILVSEDPDDRAWEQEACDQYRAWLDSAIQAHKGIVTFFD